MQVLPDGWVERHRPIVEGFFTGNRLRVERSIGSTETGDFHTLVEQWAVVYEGPGLIELPQQAPPLIDSAGGPVVVAHYVGRMPIDTDVVTGDKITVLASHDPKMIGQVFRVEYDETQDLAVDRQVRIARSVSPVRDT